MALIHDQNSYMQYDPHIVTQVHEVMMAAAKIGFGSRLKKEAAKEPSIIAEPLDMIADVMIANGVAEQKINAGMGGHDVPDERVYAQHAWDQYARHRDPRYYVDPEKVAEALDTLARSLIYINERTEASGTLSPRWNARLFNDGACLHCGR